MWQRFGSDPLDAAPAAVLRALHRRGAGQLVRVTTSPSHVALTVAARSQQCTLVFATAEAPAPRDAVEALAQAVAEGDGAVACAVPRARAIRHGPHADICLSESKQSTNATLVIVEVQGRADVWCTADMGWRRAGSSQLTEASVASAAFDGRRVFWREATGVFCRALGRRGGRLAVGLRARAADAPPDYLVAAGRGRGAWRVSAEPLVVRRGAFEQRLGGSGVVCRDGDELLVVVDTGDVVRVAYEETDLATTTWGRVKAHCRAVAPVPGGVALLGATGVVAFCPRRPFSEPVSCVAAPLNAVALWAHRGGVAVRDDNGGVWTLRPPDFTAPPPPPKRVPPRPAPPPAHRRPPRRDWKTASDALGHARRLAEAPSTAPLPSLRRAARLARELGLDPTSLFADGDELPSMLFFCRERRRDRWFGGFELFCHMCLVLRPGALPAFVADFCRAKRRSRTMRGEATDSSSGASDVSSDDGASDAEEGLLFWAGARAARGGVRAAVLGARGLCRAAAAPRSRRRRVVPAARRGLLARRAGPGARAARRRRGGPLAVSPKGGGGGRCFCF